MASNLDHRVMRAQCQAYGVAFEAFRIGSGTSAATSSTGHGAPFTSITRPVAP